MNKTCQVVAVPTGETRGAYFLTHDNEIVSNFYGDRIQWNDCKYFEVFVLSDDILKLNNYYCCPEMIEEHGWNSLSKVSEEGLTAGLPVTAKKIIATSNTVFKAGSAKLPYGFVDLYVDEYRKGNLITEVDVDYSFPSDTATKGYSIRINHLDEIVIPSHKCAFYKEEMIDYLTAYSMNVPPNILEVKLKHGKAFADKRKEVEKWLIQTK